MTTPERLDADALEYDGDSRTLIRTERLGPDEYGAAQVVARDVAPSLGAWAEAMWSADAVRSVVRPRPMLHEVPFVAFVERFYDVQRVENETEALRKLAGRDHDSDTRCEGSHAYDPYDPCGECPKGTCDDCAGCRWVRELPL